MKKIIGTTILSLLLLCSNAFAQQGGFFNPISGQMDGCINIAEIDGSPDNIICGKLKVSNGALTDNGDGTFTLTTGVGGGGDVSGPASSVDNAIVRFDGTGGKTIQDYTSGAPTCTDTGTCTFSQGVIGDLTGNASTASALAANPTDCAANNFATTIAANGDLTCAQPALGTATTGNYAASNAEAGPATSLTTDSLDAITEIAAALKTGADGTLVTGTAGSNTHCAQWNADGDLVTSGAACGGTETNSLETTITGIADTEIFIGNGADSGTFAAMSGDVTMANNGAVTIGNDKIDSQHYVDASIDLAHMSSQSVDSDNIVDATIAIGDLANGTDGQIITWAADGTATTVGPGTDGQVLTSTGAGSPPAFEDATGGGASTALDNLASVAINTALLSDTANTDALGSATYEWSDLFLGDGGVINLGNDQDVTITHVADTGIAIDSGGTSGINFGTGATSDPCGTFAEGTLFWNTTANILCVCDGTNDVQVTDASTACF